MLFKKNKTKLHIVLFLLSIVYCVQASHHGSVNEKIHAIQENFQLWKLEDQQNYVLWLARAQQLGVSLKKLLPSKQEESISHCGQEADEICKEFTRFYKNNNAQNIFSIENFSENKQKKLVKKLKKVFRGIERSFWPEKNIITRVIS